VHRVGDLTRHIPHREDHVAVESFTVVFFELGLHEIEDGSGQVGIVDHASNGARVHAGDAGFQFPAFACALG
jgi:hypothetical protein